MSDSETLIIEKKCPIEYKTHGSTDWIYTWEYFKSLELQFCWAVLKTTGNTIYIKVLNDTGKKIIELNLSHVSIRITDNPEL